MLRSLPTKHHLLKNPSPYMHGLSDRPFQTSEMATSPLQQPPLEGKMDSNQVSASATQGMGITWRLIAVENPS